ncbi:MAG: hypothetical protein AABW73_01295 [Nanoarchaeota archaeon]
MAYQVSLKRTDEEGICSYTFISLFGNQSGETVFDMKVRNYTSFNDLLRSVLEDSLVRPDHFSGSHSIKGFKPEEKRVLEPLVRLLSLRYSPKSLDSSMEGWHE